MRVSSTVVTGERWTGSPNKSTDQIDKKCPENVRTLCLQCLPTIIGHFRTFFRHFRTLSCPTICPLQLHRKGPVWNEDGDHLALLQVFKQWNKAGEKQTFARQHGLNNTALHNAAEVRQQLKERRGQQQDGPQTEEHLSIRL